MAVMGEMNLEMFLYFEMAPNNVALSYPDLVRELLISTAAGSSACIEGRHKTGPLHCHQSAYMAKMKPINKYMCPDIATEK